MARRNTNGLEFSFHKPSKRWRKRIDGKEHWFGPGESVDDIKSYHLALQNYRQLMDRTLEEKVLNQQQRNLFGALLEGQLTPTGFRQLSEIVSAKVSGRPVDWNVASPSNYSPQRTTSQTETTLTKTAPTKTQTQLQTYAVQALPEPGKTEMDVVIDGFIKELRRRNHLTENAPETMSRKQKLGSSALRANLHCLKYLRERLHLSGIKSLDDIAIESVLAEYRAELDDRIAEGTMTGQSVDSRLKAVRPLFQWVWANRRIKEMPRNLEAVLAKHARHSSAKPLSIDKERMTHWPGGLKS